MNTITVTRFFWGTTMFMMYIMNLAIFAALAQ